MTYLVFDQERLIDVEATEPTANRHTGARYINTSTGEVKESDGSTWNAAVGHPVSLSTLVSGERYASDSSLAFLSVAEEWSYHVWDHADSSPIAVSSGNPAIIGGFWCTEAFAGTPAPIIQDGTTALWAVDTATALRASVTALKGTQCATDLRITNATAGTAGKLVVQWRRLS